MDFKDKFKNILHEDENVVDTACANRKSFVLKRILIPTLLFLVLTIVLTIVAVTNPRHYVDGNSYWRDSGHYEGFPSFVVFIVSGVLLFVDLIVFVISLYASKNYFICLTDKRIIVRHGAFTTNYTYYAIDNVSGNITIRCNQSIFDRNSDNCSLCVQIELLPVGHSGVLVWTPSIVNGHEFSKKIDKQVKVNAKRTTGSTIKE